MVLSLVILLYSMLLAIIIVVVVIPKEKFHDQAKRRYSAHCEQCKYFVLNDFGGEKNKGTRKHVELTQHQPR